MHLSSPQGLPDALKTSAPPESRTDFVAYSEAITAAIEFTRSIATSAAACNAILATSELVKSIATSAAASEAIDKIGWRPREAT
jgi:hypothetical protein